MDGVACLAPQPWMSAPETRRLMAALTAEGGTARFVGGLVRDALLGRPVSDIDLATDLAPDLVMQRLAAAGLRAIPTGIDHGTVTAVVAGRHFEVTTLRRDVETDGRRARVAYTDDWAEDARRRDFTINALFADPDGTLYDPVGGLDDLPARRVRFVGDPARRIAEDVLRLLRYFRMLARFGSAEIDGPSRAACRAHAHLLPTLSGERIRGEVERILSVDDPRAALRLIEADGILPPVLPMLAAFDRLERLVLVEPAPDWLRRLAALIAGGSPAAAALAERLRLSRAEGDRLAAIVEPYDPRDLPADDRSCRDRLYAIGHAAARDRALLAAADGLDRDGVAATAVAALAVAERPVFPLAGRDALAAGVPPGPRVGALLDAVERWWIDAGYVADADACRAQLRWQVGRNDA
ncbi:MAG: CCA tRNA nucleotidyltransferase [Alphaproteobacteria bacterium]